MRATYDVNRVTLFGATVEPFESACEGWSIHGKVGAEGCVTEREEG